MNRRALATAAVLAVLAPSVADAFCGFYVSGADAKLFNDATQVVLMREGTRTVLAMQNDYQGPPADFAMVVPVPIVLQKENVKTLPRALFAKIDQLGAPRLVEYWEQDPCMQHRYEMDVRQGRAKVMASPAPPTAESRADLGVKIEAQFEVGEYEVVILSAKDALGLDTWLRLGNYKIPEGADVHFRPYVQAGSKFFVAKVNAQKVQFENGRVTLSPLRFHYDAESFNLPIRLGLINSNGKQDLIVNILAKGQRYEVANYKNVAIPTNLDVAEAARDSFGPFYAALFDHTLEKHPGAIVTEYSWDASSCDPCPGPALYPGDFATLGADVLPSAQGDGPPQAIVEVGSVEVTPESSQSMMRVRAHGVAAQARVCFTRAMEKNRTLSGQATLKLVANGFGEVDSVTVPDDLADADTRTCLRAVLNRQTFPATGGTTKTTASIPLTYRPGPPMVRPGFGSGFVLTRLHARYGKEALGEDLVFRVAPPITGGREVSVEAGQLERGARGASMNNFQGRYAIRHPWTGSVACMNPVRGRWGGPPADAPPPPGGAGAARPALKLAMAPRGGIALASIVGPSIPLGNVLAPSGPEVDPVKASGPAAGSVSGVSAPKADGVLAGGGSAPSIFGTSPSGEARQRCGSCAVVASGDGTRSALVAALAVLAVAFARARRPRR